MRKQVIVPVALGAAGALASGKGPDLVRNLADTLDGTRQQAEAKVGEKVLDTAKERLELEGGLVGRMLAKKLDNAGGGGGGSGGKTRRLPIQRWTDVAVPVEAAYKAAHNGDARAADPREQGAGLGDADDSGLDQLKVVELAGCWLEVRVTPESSPAANFGFLNSGKRR